MTKAVWEASDPGTVTVSTGTVTVVMGSWDSELEMVSGPVMVETEMGTGLPGLLGVVKPADPGTEDSQEVDPDASGFEPAGDVKPVRKLGETVGAFPTVTVVTPPEGSLSDSDEGVRPGVAAAIVTVVRAPGKPLGRPGARVTVTTAGEPGEPENPPGTPLVEGATVTVSKIAEDGDP